MSVGYDYDRVIVGGGCAGLSLAVELAARALPGRTLVIEPRTDFERDRTFCHWDVEPHRFEAGVAHSWSRWAVRFEGRRTEHETRRYRYRELPSDHFYGLALDLLRGSDQVEVALGTSASKLVPDGDGVEIATSRGTVRAGLVFDGRPPRMAAPPPLLQHFVGLRVRTDAPVFDPDTVTLMDFDVPQEPAIHFGYVLPYGPCEALVESTFFSPTPLPPAHYRRQVDRYLRERHGVVDYEVVGGESGVIPMGGRPAVDVDDPSVIPIGTAGGLVKPSTGYAFGAIQRWSRAMVAHLRAGGRPAPPPPRDRLSSALDALFLSVLRRHPERGPALLEGLFRRVSPDPLVRFLTDTARPSDRLAVVSALPAPLFLREAWRARGDWIGA